MEKRCENLAAVELVGRVVDVSTALLFVYSSYIAYSLSRRLYGGRFTAAFPMLMAALVLLSLMEVFQIVLSFYFGESDNLNLSIQMLQLAAMFLLSSFVYTLYRVGFATSGAFKVK